MSLGPTLPWGGVQAYSKDEYAANLQTSRLFDCTVSADFFKEGRWTHSFPPSIGQLERVAQDLTAMAQETRPLVLDTIAVAAMAGQAAPSKDTYLTNGRTLNV